MVTPLQWKNSTTSFFIWGASQNRSKNNNNVRVYVQKDGSTFLLDVIPIDLRNLTTLTLTEFESGSSVELVLMPNDMVILIVILLVLGIVLMFTLLSAICALKVSRSNKRESSVQNQIEEDVYIYDDAFEFRRSKACDNGKSSDIYFTEETKSCGKSSVFVDYPIEEADRKVKYEI